MGLLLSPLPRRAFSATVCLPVLRLLGTPKPHRARPKGGIAGAGIRSLGLVWLCVSLAACARGVRPPPIAPDDPIQSIASYREAVAQAGRNVAGPVRSSAGLPSLVGYARQLTTLESAEGRAYARAVLQLLQRAGLAGDLALPATPVRPLTNAELARIDAYTEGLLYGRLGDSGETPPAIPAEERIPMLLLVRLRDTIVRTCPSDNGVLKAAMEFTNPLRPDAVPPSEAQIADRQSSFAREYERTAREAFAILRRRITAQRPEPNLSLVTLMENQRAVALWGYVVYYCRQTPGTSQGEVRRMIDGLVRLARQAQQLNLPAAERESLRRFAEAAAAMQTMPDLERHDPGL